MTNKLNTRLHAIKALLFWSIRLLAIHFLLLWMKFMDRLAALKDHVHAITFQFFATVKSKLPSASLLSIKALLLWMKFTNSMSTLKDSVHTIASQLLSRARLAWMKFTSKIREQKIHSSAIFPLLLARLKHISLRGFFKSLLSRYL